MGYVHDLWYKKGPAGRKVQTKYHGKGKRWQARWETPDGEPKTRLFEKQVDAQKHVTKMDHAVLAGDYLDPEAGKVKVGDFALKTWLPAQDIKGRTEIEYRGVLDRYLIPEWGRRQIRTIKPSEAKAWQALLASKYELTGTTPNRVARHVRSVFRLAVFDKAIRASPFEGIKAPTLTETKVYPPDVAEARQIIAAAYTALWRAMFEVCALTGLRSGELRGMRLEKFDALRMAYRVDQQLVYERGKGMYLDDLKTGAGKRVLPLNRRAVDVIAAYVAGHPPPKNGPWAGLIFAMPGGKPIGESTIDWAIKQTCRYAKTEARHLHELRHHYASVLIAGGESPSVVQQRLGHKDVLTTLRIYSHLFNEAKETTRNVLDAAWAIPSKDEKRLASVTKIT
ncbi:putative phage integrase [Actinacidiphila reveromycinica]|uniref:Putative phage integrase n=1 Tax=Actinacidiphila reveromycinica TaxID=659352 RepID=A0A7U3UXN0_9ACTN|nr:site-specific integrase [Streptomyces sp. SN-593]BBB00608.1 putative phage integrase [Streptomyces sp. SN-593]BBB00661.1 putative phage integrase [Streptomyces sp. SN-593]